MKRKIITGLILLLFLICCWLLGVFTRYNFITGYIDLWKGDLRIVYYGEPDPNDVYKMKEATSMGFEYKRIAGCNVSAPLVTGAHHYNRIMRKHLSTKYNNQIINRF